MIEYGIFNDEGFLEGDFYTIEAAKARVAAEYSEESHIEVCRVCPEHPDSFRYGYCEICDAEEEN